MFFSINPLRFLEGKEMVKRMQLISRYKVTSYGGPTGYFQNRANIYLFNNRNENIARIYFRDPSVEARNDQVLNLAGVDVITIHMPSSEFQNVLDVLRNEKPVYVDFVTGTGYITTSKEPIGEGEIRRG